MDLNIKFDAISPIVQQIELLCHFEKMDKTQSSATTEEFSIANILHLIIVVLAIIENLKIL